MATTAATPETATARRNHRESGSRRRRHHAQPHHTASRSSAEPSATIVSKARWTTLTGGSSSAGNSSSPRTTPSGSWCTSSDRPAGTSSAQRISPSEYQPPIDSGAPAVVSYWPSIAASFAGWLSATVLAIQSPTPICTGVTATANASGMARPSRECRSRPPRSSPTAYTDAMVKPVTM